MRSGSQDQTGGNRLGKLTTYRNLMLTMLLGGLWHGASWNFVIWGGYHGLILSLERLQGLAKRRELGWKFSDIPRAIITFILACVGWVFFRATTFHDASFTLNRMFLHMPNGRWPVEPALMAMTVIALIAAMSAGRLGMIKMVRQSPSWVAAVGFGVLLFVVELFGVDQAIPFVYFQF